MRSFALVIIFIANIRVCYGKRYDGYSLINCLPESEDHVKFLNSLRENKHMDVIFLELPVAVKKILPVLVNPDFRAEFLQRSSHFKLKARTTLKDVQKIFDEQVLPENAFTAHNDRWTYIHTLEDIYKWLNDTAAKYPDMTKLESIGKSAEDRDIYAFSIRDPIRHDGVKVILEAGAHGNEYIGTAFTTYFINRLLNSTDSNLKSMRYKYNWYFIPILNPDGYVYSQKEDRLWRKNRRRTIGNSIGVDLNRNFGYKFGTYDSSPNPDDEHYHGPSPFSEPETQVLQNYVERKRDKLTFYFSIHGYGQKIIIPYSDNPRHIGNFHEAQRYAKQAADKMEAMSGHKYAVGVPYDLFGVKMSGDSASWVKKNYHVPYVFTLLLRDDGSYGHALPNEQLLTACKEMEQGFIELMMSTPRHLKGNLYFSSARGVRIISLPFLIVSFSALLMV